MKKLNQNKNIKFNKTISASMQIVLWLFVMCVTMILVYILNTSKSHTDATAQNINIATSFAGGDGTATNPYQIATFEQLLYLKNDDSVDIEASFILTSDITIPSSYVIDGVNQSWDGLAFVPCSFDGLGHTITFENAQAGFIGFEENSYGDYTIKNLGIKGTITCTINDSESYNKMKNVGGIIGGVQSLTSDDYVNLSVKNCYNACNLNINVEYKIDNFNNIYQSSNEIMKFGGILGGFDIKNTTGNNVIKVIDCYNTGSINVSLNKYNAKNNRFAVGGIVGGVSKKCDTLIVSNCYNNGALNIGGAVAVGGVVGLSYANVTNINGCYNNGELENSYDLGSLDIYFSGNGGIAGVVLGKGTIENCYNDNVVTTQNDGYNDNYDSAEDYYPYNIYVAGIIVALQRGSGVEGKIEIKDCYNKGTVSRSGSWTSTEIAGIYSGLADQVSVLRCYNVGSIEDNKDNNDNSSGTFSNGAIVAETGDVSQCFYLDTCINENSSTVLKGTKVTATELKKASTYSGWDFDSVWMFKTGENDDYPMLKVFQSASITIDASVMCSNGMLLLTIVDANDTVIREMSAVTGQNLSMSFKPEMNTTYRILITKPFGSVVTISGDGTQKSSTVWEINTGTSSRLSVAFILNGSGQWANTVVI